MKIAITIVVNLIIALIMFIGFKKGKRYGLKYELPKLLVLLGVLVGMYFLTPIINNKVIGISFIQTLITKFAGFDNLIYVLILIIPVGIVYGGMSLALRLIRKKSDRILLRGANRAKLARVRNIDKRVDRRLRRESRRNFRKERKNIKIKTSQQVGGIICGILISIILCFCISLPVKYVTKSIANTQENLKIVETIHDNSIYGIIDNKLISFDKVIR